MLIEQKESKVFHLPVESIKINGLKQDYELSFQGSTVSVTVRALKEYMDTLQNGSIKAELDVEDLEPGVHTLPLTVTLPDDKFELPDTINVQVTIEDKNAPPEINQDETEQPGDDNSGNSNNNSSNGNNNSPNGNNSGNGTNQNNRDSEED